MYFQKNQKTAMRVAEVRGAAARISESLRAPCEAQGANVTVRTSIGAARFPADGRSVDEVLRMTVEDALAFFADDAVVEAIGTNSLSPTTRRPAAELGREQGRRTADEIAAFLVTA